MNVLIDMRSSRGRRCKLGHTWPLGHDEQLDAEAHSRDSTPLSHCLTVRVPAVVCIVVDVQGPTHAVSAAGQTSAHSYGTRATFTAPAIPDGGDVEVGTANIRMYVYVCTLLIFKK